MITHGLASLSGVVMTLDPLSIMTPPYMGVLLMAADDAHQVTWCRIQKLCINIGGRTFLKVFLVFKSILFLNLFLSVPLCGE
jgi:hypothetical protein